MDFAIRLIDSSHSSITSHLCRIFVFIFTLNGIASSLRLTRIQVPSAVLFGDGFWLNCSYDLENDGLYSIKWFKLNGSAESIEFYRFLPNEIPQIQVYNSNGVYLDRQKSYHGNVYLSNSDSHTEGVYRCEVSADSPTFQTVRRESELKIYYLPPKGEELIVKGTKPFYKTGDTVNVTCKSGPSKPKALLSWLINGREPPIQYLYSSDDHFAAVLNPGEPRNTSLSLEFSAENRYFVNGMMRLTCTCLISLEYSLSSEVSLSTKSSKSPTTFITVQEGDGTVITGVHSAYNVGDRINLTCSSQKAKPSAPQLIWFINKDEVTTEMLRYAPITLTDESNPKRSSLRIEFVFSSAFIDVWSIKGKRKTQITLKCKAKYIKNLFETKKEEIIRRFEPKTTELKISTNEVGAVHMNNNHSSRVNVMPHLMMCSIVFAVSTFSFVNINLSL